MSAGAAVLQTDRADINNQIHSTQIVDLPLINSQGRNFQVLYKILPGFTPARGGSLGIGQSAALHGDPGQRHAAVQQQHQARRRYHQPSVAAAPGRLPAAGGSGGDGQRGEQQLRRGTGNGRRSGDERHHQVRHQHVPRLGMGVSDQQRAEGAQLFLLPLLLHGRSQPRRRRMCRTSSAARSADRSSRTSCSSSPIGNGPRAAWLHRRCGPCPRPRCAPATSTAPAPPSTIPGPAIPTAPAAPRSRTTRFPPTASIRPPAYMANLIPQPNQSVYPE